MKTTLEIPDALFSQAKRLAGERNWTLRMVVEESLRQFLEQPSVRDEPFRLQHTVYGGPETSASTPTWVEVRDLIYGLPAAEDEG